MSLTISDISFWNFRNYESLHLSGIGPLTIFVGANAVGKTNIIEGIQLLTAQTSFRRPLTEQLVHMGAQTSHLKADIEGDERKLCIELLIEEGKKKRRLNGKSKQAADLKGVLPSVTFTPDDLNLVKGSMSLRRGALDALGEQLSKNHYLIRHDYEKVIRHKNHLLKEEASTALIDSINEMVVTVGAQLTCYRMALFKKMEAVMSSYYSKITGEKESLTMLYIPSWEVENKRDVTYLKDQKYKNTAQDFSREDVREYLFSALQKQEQEEIARRRSLVGPHADRLLFYIDGKLASAFGSQGQQRSIVLAFKLAEASLIQEVVKQNPILLLDDVMSELDAQRRRELVEYIAGDIQTFITTTNLSYFDKDLLDKAQIIKLPLND